MYYGFCNRDKNKYYSFDVQRAMVPVNLLPKLRPFFRPNRSVGFLSLTECYNVQVDSKNNFLKQIKL
jgi:hypothetical protein